MSDLTNTSVCIECDHPYKNNHCCFESVRSEIKKELATRKEQMDTRKELLKELRTQCHLLSNMTFGKNIDEVDKELIKEIRTKCKDIENDLEKALTSQKLETLDVVSLYPAAMRAEINNLA